MSGYDAADDSRYSIEWTMNAAAGQRPYRPVDAGGMGAAVCLP